MKLGLDHVFSFHPIARENEREEAATIRSSSSLQEVSIAFEFPTQQKTEEVLGAPSEPKTRDSWSLWSSSTRNPVLLAITIDDICE